MEGPDARFDASILDALDWKLGAGRGRMVLLGMTCRPIYSFHASWALLECLREEVKQTRSTSRFGQYAIRITLAEGVVWDGETLTVPGTWPETVTNGLAGRRVMEMVDHPAIPRDRLIESVRVGPDGIEMKTVRRVIGRSDLLSPTRRGRLADRWALWLAEARFNLSQRIHSGICFLSLLSAFLGAILGLIGGAIAALAIGGTLHLLGVPDAIVDFAALLIPLGGIAGMTLLYVQQHCDMMIGGVNIILDRMGERFGRGFV